MRLPAPLLRHSPHVHKNTFGHVFVLAGSRNMLGAAALTGLAAMRCGAGLVTIGVPASLNATLQKKISPVIMTLALPETREQSLSNRGFTRIFKFSERCQSIALGPGLSRNPDTQKLIQKIISACPVPMVIDADALNVFSVHRPSSIPPQTMARPRQSTAGGLAGVHRLVLTPHPGEMARLIGKNKEWVEKNRKKVAKDFAIKNKVILVLKGHRTVVADPSGKIYINKTGNAGMATAGSGDVLTGMIAAFLAQGISAFEAAKYGVYMHGLAGDLAAKEKTRAAMISTDIIETIPKVIKVLCG